MNVAIGGRMPISCFELFMDGNSLALKNEMFFVNDIIVKLKQS